MNRRFGGTATVIAAAALLASACGGGEAAAPDIVRGGDMDALVEAAQQEGSLMVYSSIAEDQLEILTSAFTEEYGISVEVLRLNSSELAQRFSSEVGANSVRADLFEYSGSELFEEEPQWFVEATPEDIPGLDDWPTQGVTEHSVVSTVFPYSYTYNSDQVSESDLPDSWSDFADTAWDGKILFTDPRSSPSYIGWAHDVETDLGPDTLTGIGNLDFTLVDSAAPGAQQVAAGEYAVNFPSQPVHAVPLIKAGAPINFKILTDPPIVLSVNMGIPQDAPHPNAARLFAAWKISQEGQEASCEHQSVSSPISPNGEIENCLELPAEWRPVAINLGDERSNELLDLMNVG